MIVHVIVVALATLFGWDIIRRLIPARVPGSVARLAAAALATGLILVGPTNPLLLGAAVAGILMLANHIVEVEPVYQWWSKLKKTEKPQFTSARQMFEQTMKPAIGKKADAGSIGNRIPDL